LILACSFVACQEDAPKNRFDDIKIDPTIYYQPTPVGDRVPFADMMVAANQLIIMLDATADEPTRAEILTVLDATVIGELPSIRVLQLSLDAPDEAALRDACAVARALT